MTVLPESFPFPSPSLLLPPPRGDGSLPIRSGVPWGCTDVHLRERPCGAGVPLVPVAWLAPRESINRPSHHTGERERREKKREEGRKRKEGRGGGEKWGLKYGGAGKCTQPAHARASTPRRLASTHCL